MAAAPPTPSSQVLDETDPHKPQEFSEEDDRLFLSLENYCWENDPEFQSGLTQILTTATTPQQIRQLTRQAKCFFYSRKISRQIPFDLYSAWLDREESSPPRRSPSEDVLPPIEPSPIDSLPSGEPAGCEPSGSIDGTPTANTTVAVPGAAGSGKEDDKTPYPTSFAQIVELITSGKPIPGIREIPNTLNEAPPTESTAPQRRKPWEVAASQQG
ncbi:hypothetical protein ABW19_dt0209067 [Dactylella cylindrospora]|nr:hypothetical protein ABW19_dt0209067 [Dactylella cylindrospora]